MKARSLWKYARYFAKRHPKVIEDEKAVEVIIRLEEDAAAAASSSSSQAAPVRRLTVRTIGDRPHVEEIDATETEVSSNSEDIRSVSNSELDTTLEMEPEPARLDTAVREREGIHAVDYANVAAIRNNSRHSTNESIDIAEAEIWEMYQGSIYGGSEFDGSIHEDNMDHSNRRTSRSDSMV